MKYKYKYLTQTQIGRFFDVSNQTVGKWLVELGLRDAKTKKPTNTAHDGGYCDTAPSGPSGYHWVWEAEKTMKALLGAGHPLAAALPTELTDPPELLGPFTVCPRSPQHVLNAGGEVVVRATIDRNAGVVARLLNAAHRSGVLDRLVTPQKPAATAN